MQYQELYREGEAKLSEAGIAESALDARYLLEYVCGTDRNTLLVHGERQVSPEEEKRYREALLQRAGHIPLQHLMGTQEFMGLTFQVNENVLIPRQDTEILVEEVLRHLHDGMRILDLCTGSGCILISLLHYSNDCEGVGSDLSKEALLTARENADRLLTKEHKISFVQGDLFEKIEGRFEILVSNPPYISTGVCETLMPEVRDHEPRMALDGGEDGLDFYRRIAGEGSRVLCNGGMVFLEIGYDQAQAVREILEAAGYLEIQVVQDFAGLDRVVYATWQQERT